VLLLEIRVGGFAQKYSHGISEIIQDKGLLHDDDVTPHTVGLKASGNKHIIRDIIIVGHANGVTVLGVRPAARLFIGIGEDFAAPEFINHLILNLRQWHRILTGVGEKELRRDHAEEDGQEGGIFTHG
jgi:hypothetical protein